MKPGSKVFVAGHQGLLGSAVLRRLAREPVTPVLASRSELDLRDQSATFRFFRESRPEYIFLCAAKVGGIQANLDSPAEFLYDNLTIQANVIEAAFRNGAKKLIFPASNCVYPSGRDHAMPETELLTGAFEPTNEAYAVAKVAGLKLCQYYRRQHGCDFICAIPASLFGPNDNYDPRTSHLIAALIAKAHRAKISKNQEISLWGTGQVHREAIFSDDCADALVFLMRHYSGEEPINVGTATDRTVAQWAALVAEVVGVTASWQWDTKKPDGIRRKLLDSEKLYRLGWKPSTPIKDALEATYREYLKTEKL